MFVIALLPVGPTRLCVLDLLIVSSSLARDAALFVTLSTVEA